jgi:hypothetical protein
LVENLDVFFWGGERVCLEWIFAFFST